MIESRFTHLVEGVFGCGIFSEACVSTDTFEDIFDAFDADGYTQLIVFHRATSENY